MASDAEARIRGKIDDALRSLKPDATHAEVVDAIRIAFIGDRDVRLWKNNRLVAKLANGRKVSAGIDGQADLTGIIRGGLRLEIEAKTPRDAQRPAQRAFERMMVEFGGIYILARAGFTQRATP